MSRVDVIVPCYGYAHFLRECVESVLAQQRVALRVLIIDDASPDDTATIAAELAAQDERVEIRRHDVNRGHIATYNEGLRWARGEYTLLLDADDVLTPGSLARAATLMDAHPEVGLTYGRAIESRDTNAALVSPAGADAGRVVESRAWIERCCRAGGNLVPTPTAVVRTGLLDRLGDYRPDLPHAADMELWLRLGANAPVGIIDADQAYYRRHDTNMSLNYAGIGDLRERRAVFEVFFAGHGARLAESNWLCDMAFRRLAQETCRQAMAAFFAGKLGRCRELLTLAMEIHPRGTRRARWRGVEWLRLAEPMSHTWLRSVKRRFKALVRQT